MDSISKFFVTRVGSMRNLRVYLTYRGLAPPRCPLDPGGTVGPFFF